MSVTPSSGVILKCQICDAFRSDAQRDRFVLTQCGHTFHNGHLLRWLNESVGSRCPTCKKLIDPQKLIPIYGYDPSNRKLKIKIAVLGNSGVGKSCLVERFATGVRNMNVLPTTGYKLHRRELEVDFEKVDLNIWEPAGTERFHQVVPQCLRDCHGVIFCYERMHFQSLVDVNRVWKDLASRYVRNENYVSVLLECKNDAANCSCDRRTNVCRPITDSEKNTALDFLGTDFFTTSALSSADENLEAPFRHVIGQILRNESLMEQILNDSLDSDRIQLVDDGEQTETCWEKFKKTCSC